MFVYASMGDQMATCRPRGNRFEFVIKRSRLLPRPIYLSFDTEEEGRTYCDHLETLLDQGIVPREFLEVEQKSEPVREIIKDYIDTVAIKPDDEHLLWVIYSRIGPITAKQVDYNWAEKWVSDMKLIKNLAPSTIRHHVGALARCFDWANRKDRMASNPLRMLPKGYANYTGRDKKLVEPKQDVERDRRLEGEEEERIRKVLKGGYKPDGKQRPLLLDHRLAMTLMFDLALETAMRMREIFTLNRGQINISRKTIFLEKTKNGDKRQVPLSTVAIDVIERYLKTVPKRDRGPGDLVFPWWNGAVDRKELAATTSILSRRWSRVFDHAGCPDLRFHDLRHEATSRFYERTALSDLQISRITGHKNLEMLRRYANLRGSDLAGQLW